MFVPRASCRFRAALVNQMIVKVLKEALADKQYSGEEAKQWSKEICDTLQANLKGLMFYHFYACALKFFSSRSELELNRYKFVVQVVIGELRGEGVK